MRRDFKFPSLLTALGMGVVLLNGQEAPPAKEKPSPIAPPTKPAPVPKAVSPRVALNKYHEEQFRRMRAEIEELKNAYNLQIRKGQALEAEVKRMRAENAAFQRELALKFASAKDITDLAGKIRELDQNRRNDLKVTNDQIDEILKIVKRMASTPKPVRNPGSGSPEVPPENFKYREHKVQAGEFLSTILQAYNQAFKEAGLKGRTSQSQVVKANPGLNPNRLLIGQKIRIPEPGEIK